LELVNHALPLLHDALAFVFGVPAIHQIPAYLQQTQDDMARHRQPQVQYWFQKGSTLVALSED
jgi:hypothetical protein